MTRSTLPNIWPHGQSTPFLVQILGGEEAPHTAEIFLPDLSAPAQQAIGVLWSEVNDIPVSPIRHRTIEAGFNPNNVGQRDRVLAHLNTFVTGPALTFCTGANAANAPVAVAAGAHLRDCHLWYTLPVAGNAGSALVTWGGPHRLDDNLLRRAINLSMGSNLEDVRRVGIFGLVIAAGRMGEIPTPKRAKLLSRMDYHGRLQHLGRQLRSSNPPRSEWLSSRFLPFSRLLRLLLLLLDRVTISPLICGSLK